MANRRAVNAEKRIDIAAAKAGCTQEGITWMKNAVDPFPDCKRRIVGYPDTVRTPSVSQYFREELTIQAPASASGGNWDANIFHPGWMNNQEINPTSHENFQLFVATASVAQFASMITVMSGPSGSALSWGSSTSTMTPAVSLTSMPWRIVSLGFEVFNTTAPLYKQGGVTTWRQQAKFGEQRTVNLGATLSTKITSVTSQQYAQWPTTAAQALALEGSLAWEASEGSYTVGIQEDSANRVKFGLPRFNYIVDNSSNIPYCPFIIPTANTCTANAVNSESAFSQFGAYYTGLSNSTTLKIVVHYVIERFPDYFDADLISIATPSIPYDPQALELYCKLTAQMPTGTEVENNFLGAFLSGLASIASTVGPPLIGALNGYLNPQSKNTSSDHEALLRTIQMQQQTQAALMSLSQPKVTEIVKPQIIEVVKSPGVIARREKKQKGKKTVGPGLKGGAMKSHSSNRPQETYMGKSGRLHLGANSVPWGVPTISNQRPKRSQYADQEAAYAAFLRSQSSNGRRLVRKPR